MIPEEVVDHQNNLSELKIILCYLSDMGFENMAQALNWIMLDYRTLIEYYTKLKYPRDKK